MPTYDQNKIGKLLALSEHAVYEYGNDHVIKFSVVPERLGKRKVAKDYKICKEFFADYLLEIEEHTSPDGKHVAIVQPRMRVRYLKKRHLHEENIKRQYKEIMKSFEELVRAGHAPIDLIGRPGFFGGYFGNIFIAPDKKLKIIDTDLLEIKFQSILRPLYVGICKLTTWRQNQILKKFSA